MQGADDESPGFAVRFGIEAADELIAIENRQAEVSIFALLSRCVRFQLQLEVEDAKRSLAIPDEAVER